MSSFASHESLSWRPHHVVQLDGAGGRISHRAMYRFLPLHEGVMVYPWGLAKMDNGEIAVAGVAHDMRQRGKEQTVLAFSSDHGATWTDYVPVPDCTQRPMMLVYLGDGQLSFMTKRSDRDRGNVRLYSHDYGRTWTERVQMPDTPEGIVINSEGNSLVDRDEHGRAVLIGETGQIETGDRSFGAVLMRGCVRWSHDGGRTWDRVSWPVNWHSYELHEGKSYERGVGEGGMVRAANGWIVVALRTDPPIRYSTLNYDNFDGTAVTISRDDGETWSDLVEVFGPGRHHANLLRLPGGDLVITVIRRLHLDDNGLASYRRGLDSVVSRDNGLTWETDRMYILDDFAAIGRELWYSVRCGHVFSIPLDDGQVLSTYGYYDNAGALILWRP